MNIPGLIKIKYVSDARNNHLRMMYPPGTFQGPSRGHYLLDDNGDILGSLSRKEAMEVCKYNIQVMQDAVKKDMKESKDSLEELHRRVYESNKLQEESNKLQEESNKLQEESKELLSRF